MVPRQHSCSPCLHSPTEVLLSPASCVGCVKLGPYLLQVPVPADLLQWHREACVGGGNLPAAGLSGGKVKEEGHNSKYISHC